jgi:hypothetical protein
MRFVQTKFRRNRFFHVFQTEYPLSGRNTNLGRCGPQLATSDLIRLRSLKVRARSYSAPERETQPDTTATCSADSFFADCRHTFKEKQVRRK